VEWLSERLRLYAARPRSFFFERNGKQAIALCRADDVNLITACGSLAEEDRGDNFVPKVYGRWWRRICLIRDVFPPKTLPVALASSYGLVGFTNTAANTFRNGLEGNFIRRIRRRLDYSDFRRNRRFGYRFRFR